MPPSQSSELPLVTLDTTVADLYRKHGICEPLLATTQPVFATIDLHPQLPRESVYPEDAEPFPPGESEHDMANLRATVLDLKPIKRVFPLGNMDVVLFTQTDKDALRILFQLPFNQRPTPHFVDLEQGNMMEKFHELSKGRKLVYWTPQGWMQDFDCLIDPKLIYELNSKQFLVSSGICTPESEIVELTKENIHDSTLYRKNLPFVVKLLRATSGYGTWLVTSELRRQDMLQAIHKHVMQGGKEVVLSAYINMKLDLSVHILVGAEGDERDRQNPLIVAVSVQNLSTAGHWTGGRIDYSAQPALKDLVRDTVLQTGRLLPKGFVGWAGLDIIVDEAGKQWVVDLNPRWTGSVPLCLLSNHFFTERGLPHAEFGAFAYEGSVDDIYELLHSDLHSGKVIINSAAKFGEQSNMADLVWGGQSIEDLIKTAESIKLKLSKRSR